MSPSSDCRREQLWYTDQVVARHGQRELESEPVEAGPSSPRIASWFWRPTARQNPLLAAQVDSTLVKAVARAFPVTKDAGGQYATIKEIAKSERNNPILASKQRSDLEIHLASALSGGRIAAQHDRMREGHEEVGFGRCVVSVEITGRIQ